MRRAWNTRRPGCPPSRRAAAGIAALIISTSLPVVSMGADSRCRTMNWAMRDAHFSSPYARKIKASSLWGHVLIIAFAVRLAGLVHAHVQRRIVLIGKPALGIVQLPGRNAQIKERNPSMGSSH